ncbi:pilus assembly protein PilM [Thermithiobacillus plumbiphilus]|uniref:Pilus assembly protein PilM n=1 Tax=Thermithiobacillus plumbiphilus TaxID=1729899 RepID=A0ABU9D854_9PROT
MNLDFLKLDLRKLLRRPRAGTLLALDLRPSQASLCQVDRQGRPTFLKRLPLSPDQQHSREALAELLSRQVREHNLAGSPCVSVLHRPDYQLLLVEAPQVPEAEILSALRWKIADQIDFPVNEAILDYFELPPGQTADTRQIYVVAARESVVQARVDLLRGIGLDPAYIDIAEKAQRNLAARLPEDEQGLALLEIAEDESLLTITRQGQLIFSRAIAFGTGNLVDGLVESAGFAPEMARAQIGTEGLGEPEILTDILPAAQQILRQQAERLALELQRSLDYYDSRFRRGAVRQTYVLFDSLHVPHLAPYLGVLTGAACRDFPAIDGRDASHRMGLLSYGAALRELLS